MIENLKTSLNEFIINDELGNFTGLIIALSVVFVILFTFGSIILAINTIKEVFFL